MEFSSRQIKTGANGAGYKWAVVYRTLYLNFVEGETNHQIFRLWNEASITGKVDKNCNIFDVDDISDLWLKLSSSNLWGVRAGDDTDRLSSTSLAISESLKWSHSPLKSWRHWKYGVWTTEVCGVNCQPLTNPHIHYYLTTMDSVTYRSCHRGTHGIWTISPSVL